jgi:hypothetical protein
MTSPTISVGALTRRYRGQLVLDGVTFDTQDVAWLDRLVRAWPEVAYDYEELFTEAAVAEYTSTMQPTGEPTPREPKAPASPGLCFPRRPTPGATKERRGKATRQEAPEASGKNRAPVT